MTSTACCAGVTHAGTPKGTVGTLYGLPTYIAEPANSEPNAIVVMLPDAFGWEFVNLRLLADTFAERIGVRCLMPEFMQGKAAAVSSLFDLKSWMSSSTPWYSKIIYFLKAMWELAPFGFNNRFSVCWPRIEPWFRSLRESTDLRIGAVGYCWGGRYAITLAHGLAKSADGRPLIDAAFTAHPSNLTFPADIENIKLPVFISHAGEDMVVNDRQLRMIQDIFGQKEKENGGEEHYVVEVVEGAKHGFAARGDPNDEEELRQGQMAEDQAVDWFGRWLVGKGNG